MGSAARSTVLVFCLCWVAVECGGLVEWPLGLMERSGVQSNGGVPLLDPPYHSAGYMKLNGTYDAKLFYFYFEERNHKKDAPLVFWTNGGPGCSSLFGLFLENGPYKVDRKTGDLSLSEYGWDIGQNMLFVEQPVGVGFSDSGDERDFAHFEKTVGDDMLMFFWEFMEKHPEMKDRPLYISGESYAGHYLPAIAKRIHDANTGNEGPKLNLKGIILGNPWTDPGIQEISEVDFSEMHGLISHEVAASLRPYSDLCLSLVDVCTETLDQEKCLHARHICHKYIKRPIYMENPSLDPYDIRCKRGECHNISHIVAYLNTPAVQEKLGVEKEWVDCSSSVHQRMKADMYTSMKSTFEFLLKEAKLRTIIYVGDQDFICNWVGNQRWIRSMQLEGWTGELSEWRVDGDAAGECETVEPLTYCTVYDAGHLVPYNKGKVALDMVQRFIAKGAFVEENVDLPRT